MGARMEKTDSVLVLHSRRFSKVQPQENPEWVERGSEFDEL